MLPLKSPELEQVGQKINEDIKFKFASVSSFSMLVIKMERERAMDEYLLNVLNTAFVLFNVIYRAFNEKYARSL